MNTVSLIGRLTADPDLCTTNGGTPVCTARLAVNRARKDGQGQGAVFIDVVSFGRQAEAGRHDYQPGRRNPSPPLRASAPVRDLLQFLTPYRHARHCPGNKRPRAPSR